MAIYSMDINNSNNAKVGEIISASEHHNYLKRQGKFAPTLEEKNDRELFEKTKGSEHINYIQRKEVFSKIEKYEDLVLALDKNMPNWVKDNPNNFWINADKYEKGNRIRYHSFILSLPKEFTDEENIKLVKTYCEKTFGKDFVYSVGIHKKKTRDGKYDNPHVHIMFSDRKLDGIERDPEIFFKRANKKYPKTGGAAKDRKWNSKYMYRRERKNWENILNAELEKHGLEKVSCESLERQLELARDRKDILKEIYLDRPPINCPGRILQKIDRIGVEKLSKREKELYRDYQNAIKCRDISLAAIKEIKSLQKEEQINLRKEKEESKIFSNAKNTIINRCEKILLEEKKMKSKLLTNINDEILDRKFYGAYMLGKQKKYANENLELKINLINTLESYGDNYKIDAYFTKENEQKLSVYENKNEKEFEFKLEYYSQLRNMRTYFEEQKNKLEIRKSEILKEYNDFYNEKTFYENFENIERIFLTDEEKQIMKNYKSLKKEFDELMKEKGKIESSIFGIFYGKKSKEINSKIENTQKKLLKQLEVIQEKVINPHFKELVCHYHDRYKSTVLEKEWGRISKEIFKLEDEINLYKLSYDYVDNMLYDLEKENEKLEKTKKEAPKNNKELNARINKFAKAYSDYLINHLKLKGAIETYESPSKLNNIATKSGKTTDQIRDNYFEIIKELDEKEKEMLIDFKEIKKSFTNKFMVENLKYIRENKSNIINSFSYLQNSDKYYNKKAFEYRKDFVDNLANNKIKEFYNTNSLDAKISDIKLFHNIGRRYNSTKVFEKPIDSNPIKETKIIVKEEKPKVVSKKMEEPKKEIIIKKSSPEKPQTRKRVPYQHLKKVESTEDYMNRTYGKKKNEGMEM